jgi:hypothetical protein
MPLKRLDSFDAALASLESLVAAPVQISWTLATRDGAWPDGVHNSALSPHAV